MYSSRQYLTLLPERESKMKSPVKPKIKIHGIIFKKLTVKVLMKCCCQQSECEGSLSGNVQCAFCLFNGSKARHVKAFKEELLKLV
jgi:hypothetical protein